jgi:hypothetical protein
MLSLIGSIFQPIQLDVLLIFFRMMTTMSMESFEELLDIVGELLIESIIQKVGTLDLKESVYCIALVWSPGQLSSLPPYIWFGLNRERELYIEKYEEDAKMYFWNTAEFSIYADLQDDDELIRSCELLDRQCNIYDNWNEAAKMLNEVAKFLGTFDWSDRLQTTSNFVVFANDIEGSDFHQNFKFSVSEKLLKIFKQKNWLL